MLACGLEDSGKSDEIKGRIWRDGSIGYKWVGIRAIAPLLTECERAELLMGCLPSALHFRCATAEAIRSRHSVALTGTECLESFFGMQEGHHLIPDLLNESSVAQWVAWPYICLLDREQSGDMRRVHEGGSGPGCPSSCRYREEPLVIQRLPVVPQTRKSKMERSIKAGRSLIQYQPDSPTLGQPHGPSRGRSGKLGVRENKKGENKKETLSVEGQTVG